MVDIAQRLATLSTRPPTPPRGRNEHSVDTSSPNGYFARVTQEILLDTPNDSPSSSAEYLAGSSEKGTKKVEFSPWPRFHKPTMFGGSIAGLEANIRRLPPSRDCKSSKSILKETFRSSPLAELPTLDASNIPKMLQSATLHLRSASRSSRLDAYSALLACMSAYDDVPDTEALSKSLPEFVDFIRRDICATADAKGTLDTQLASQSLKLLTVLLCTSALANSLPEDFRGYILEKSIASIEDVTLPKILVSHHMQVLAKQNFSGKHMTNERANRLLSALEGITDHQKGNSIIGLRLRIYQRLLTLAKPSVVAHAEHWIDHLVSGMLSTSKDIRALAINFGIDAGVNLGSTGSVSQACFDLFNRKSPEGQTVVDFLAARLSAMTACKEESVHVPQIWSVVILLLRNRRHKLERWLHLKPWLMVLQQCFNSSEAHTKLLAMTAWNRLVFAIEPDTSTTPQMVKMLRQPVVAQLSRKGSDKHSKQSKQIAQSSYCNLLYYAFRPLATHTQIDLYWDHYIDQVLPESFTSTKRDIDRACEILAALLHNEQPRPWDENRANASDFIKPDELPSLNPKWVRSRADKVLIVFGKLVHLAAWNSSEQEKLPILVAWRSFTKSLGDAGKQEVKVSMETMAAVAHVLNMMKRFWDQAYLEQPKLPSTDFSTAMEKLQALIQEAILYIGPIPFNEPRLLQSSHHLFEAAETPSSRSDRHHGPLCSPTTHLLRLLVNSITNDAAVEKYTPVMRNLLEVALSSTSSRRSQLGILRQLTALVCSGDATRSRARLALWCLIAEATESALGRARPSDTNSDSPQYAGHEFRDAAKILEIGIYHHSGDTTSTWQKLFSVLSKALREEIGDGGVILILTEPLSAAIRHQFSAACDDSLFACAASVIQSVTWPNSQQVLDRARKLLWGISATGQKLAPLDPFEKFYSMVERGFTKAYEDHASTGMSVVTEFLCVVEFLLASSPVSAKGVLLRRVQRGAASWIEDQQGILAGFAVGTDLEKLHGTVQALWTACKAAIELLPHTNATLRQFDALVTSSLSSRHRSILNDAIALWNGTFGTAEHLEYPDDLRIALSRLSKVTDLQLPSFPDEDDTEAASSPFNFVESQNSQQDKGQEWVRTPTKLAHVSPKIQRRITLAKPTSSPRHHLVSPESNSLRRTTASRISKTPSKARLRHNDSQIHFAAIESSPLASEDNESQLLTDHQKEIKERQTRDAAMFPRLGSSPPPNGRKTDQELPRLLLGGGGQPRVDIEPDDHISPTLPVIDGNLEAFLGSSPTPRSSRKFSSDPPSDGGPPSSPPGVPSLAAVFSRKAEPTSSAAVGEEDVRLRESRRLETETLHQSRNVDEETFPKVMADRSVVTNDRPEAVPIAPDLKGHEVLKEGVDAIKDVDMHVFSDFDIFVDAPTEPLRGSSPAGDSKDDEDRTAHVIPSSPEPPLSSEVKQASRFMNGVQATTHAASTDLPPESEDSTSRVMDSFLSQSSHFSNDDEQISAQLAVDMERASSQAERTGGDLQTTESTKKRKRRGSAATTAVKRLRSSSQVQNCYVVVETQRPNVTDDDCIILDTRSANNSPHRSSPHTKQERPASPSDFAQEISSALKYEKNMRASIREAAARKRASHPMTPKAPGNQAPAAQMQRSKENSAEDPASKLHAQRRSAHLGRASEKQDQKMQNGDRDTETALAPKEADQRQIASSQQDNNPSSSAPSPRKSPYRRLMDGFKNILGEIRHMTLGVEERREVTGVLLESILAVHEAGTRHPPS